MQQGFETVINVIKSPQSKNGYPTQRANLMLPDECEQLYVRST